jgi:hypothetical protein
MSTANREHAQRLVQDAKALAHRRRACLVASVALAASATISAARKTLAEAADLPPAVIATALEVIDHLDRDTAPPSAAASAEGLAAAVALLGAQLQQIGLTQEDLIEEVPIASVLRTLVVVTVALMRAVIPEEAAWLLRTLGAGAVEITSMRGDTDERGK